MAVSNLFNSLTFGRVSSADYGIYITGEAVYNAPKRVVNMVDVPGRNGAIAIDQGRWENIEIEYPAGTFGMDAEEFGTALSNFRNAIVSQIGYQRLTDTYHPDEYRMAMYVSGLDVSPKHYNSAGEFNLTFNCKPQRWLANGETAIVVASGDTLTNPTPYDAGPLLSAEGYGTIGFNGFEIELEDGNLGTVALADAGTLATITIPAGILNPGDVITINAPLFSWTVATRNGYQFGKGTYTVTDSNSSATTTFPRSGDSSRSVSTSFATVTANYGTAKTVTNTSGAAFYITNGTLAPDVTTTVVQSISYDGDRTITIKYTSTQTSNANLVITGAGISHGAITAASSVNVLGHPTYIDCEIGEAYKIEYGEYISLNKYIALGSDLPILKSGANERTLDNTVTELKVQPNWWKL